MRCRALYQTAWPVSSFTGKLLKFALSIINGLLACWLVGLQMEISLLCVKEGLMCRQRCNLMTTSSFAIVVISTQVWFSSYRIIFSAGLLRFKNLAESVSYTSLYGCWRNPGVQYPGLLMMLRIFLFSSSGLHWRGVIARACLSHKSHPMIRSRLKHFPRRVFVFRYHCWGTTLRVTIPWISGNFLFTLWEFGL